MFFFKKILAVFISAKDVVSEEERKKGERGQEEQGNAHGVGPKTKTELGSEEGRLEKGRGGGEGTRRKEKRGVKKLKISKISCRCMSP